jgi:hypothetical protein
MHAIMARRDLIASTSLAHDLTEDFGRSQQCGQRLRRDPAPAWRRLRGTAIGLVRNAPERPTQATCSIGECDALMRPPRSHDRGQHQCASRDGAGVLPREGVALCRRRSSTVNIGVSRIRIRAIASLSVRTQVPFLSVPTMRVIPSPMACPPRIESGRDVNSTR